MFESRASQLDAIDFQIALRIALHNGNLFSVDSCDLLPRSQYIFLTCFRSVDICFFSNLVYARDVVLNVWRLRGISDSVGQINVTLFTTRAILRVT